MDDWGWDQLRPWLEHRGLMPVGPLFCVVNGPTRGRPWSGSAAREQLRRLAVAAGVRRRFAPHQLRHAHAVEMAREGVPLNVIQRQLGHADLGVTSVYLQGLDNTEARGAGGNGLLAGADPPLVLSFRRRDDVERLHDVVKFHWEAVSPDGEVTAVGLDFLVLGAEGRIRRDYVFIES
jgi:hypothetical protein